MTSLARWKTKQADVWGSASWQNVAETMLYPVPQRARRPAGSGAR